MKRVKRKILKSKNKKKRRNRKNISKRQIMMEKTKELG
jgi:hypothetical protein